MRLIAEEITSVDFLCEEKEGKKNYFIEGVFLQSEIKNRKSEVGNWKNALSIVFAAFFGHFPARLRWSGGDVHMRNCRYKIGFFIIEAV